MLRSADGMDWDRIEKTTMRRPLARVAVSLAVLLAHDLLDAPVPTAVPGVMHVTERTRTFTQTSASKCLLGDIPPRTFRKTCLG
jgi:hypothetical protein